MIKTEALEESKGMYDRKSSQRDDKEGSDLKRGDRERGGEVSG